MLKLKDQLPEIFAVVTKRLGKKLSGVKLGVLIFNKSLDRFTEQSIYDLVERLHAAGAIIRLFKTSGSVDLAVSEDNHLINALSPYDAVHWVHGVLSLGDGQCEALDFQRLACLMLQRIWFEGRFPEVQVDREAMQRLDFEIYYPGEPSRTSPCSALKINRSRPNWKIVHGIKIRGIPPDFSLPPLKGNGNDYRFIEQSLAKCSKNKPSPSLSIIALNGNQKWYGTLSHLLEQEQYLFSKIELILPYSTSMAKNKVEWGPKLKVRTLEVEGPADVRNLGIRSATGDWIVMLENPALPKNEWFKNLVRWLDVEQRIVFISSCCPEILDQVLFPFHKADGGAIAFPRDLFEKVGWFADGTRDAYGLTIEWLYRAYQRGTYFLPLRLEEKTCVRTVAFSDQSFIQEGCPLGYRKETAKQRFYAVPKVSVYIPAYNAERTLKEAVDSVLAQDYSDLEVCIVNDGSTDGTRQVLEQHYANNPRVRWMHQQNAGISAASNAAIQLCRGAYIGQLDADDRLEPHAVRTLVNVLDHQNVGYVYGSHDVIDANGQILYSGWEWPYFSRMKLMVSNIVHHFRMFRKRDWERTGGFDPSLLSAEDYDFALRMSEITEFYHITTALYHYRKHDSNTSAVNYQQMRHNHYLAMHRALVRRKLDNSWEVLPSTSTDALEGLYHKRDNTMNPKDRDVLINEVVEVAKTFLTIAPNNESLQELALKIAAERFRLSGWWRFSDTSSYLKSTDSKLFGRLLAAQVETDQGNREAALEHAQAVLSALPRDLYTQRLIEELKVALGQPGWTKADEEDLSQRFCSAPFERMETRPDGSVAFCCDSWMNVAIGNINKDKPEAIWNSSNAQEVRASILEGRYTYCSRTRCPKILNKMLPLRSEVQSNFSKNILVKKEKVLSSKPRDIKLNHDRSCNLSCPSCRQTVYAADEAESARLKTIADGVILPLLNEAEVVEITGSGDAFASKHFRYIMQHINHRKFPSLKIDLFTNGIMFTEFMWEKLNLWGLCRRAVISVDSTREETYQILRRGGTLERLLENFPFISKLRQSGELERVVLVFVIQRENYMEIPDMIRLTKQFNFDETFLKVIDPWGQSTAVYEDKNVALTKNSLHQDFLRILQNPLLNDPVVNLGTLKQAHNRALAAL